LRGSKVEGGSPTLRRRRLGRALRRLREGASLTGDEAGREVERSGSWISRVEAGKVGLRTRDLRELLDLYRLDDPQRRSELEELAREGKQRGWWSKYADAIHESYALFIGLEDEAQQLYEYEHTVVPGLLQTEGYCRAITRMHVPPTTPPELVEARVEVRMARQARIAEKPPAMRLVLDEALLHRAIGGQSTLKDQLARLADAAAEPWMDIRVVPFSQSGYVVAKSSFVLMGFRQDPEIVYIETPIGGLFEDGQPAVDQYRSHFELLASAALDRRASADLLEEMAGRQA
jgi:hypothetical protein